MSTWPSVLNHSFNTSYDRLVRVNNIRVVDHSLRRILVSHSHQHDTHEIRITGPQAAMHFLPNENELGHWAFFSHIEALACPHTGVLHLLPLLLKGKIV